MPLALNKSNNNNTTAPTVVAWQSFDSAEGIAVEGQEFYATDPIVVAHPDLFVALGTPRALWPSVMDRFDRESEETEKAKHDSRVDAAKQNRVRVNVAVAKAKRDIIDFSNTRTVVKGSVLLVTDPLVLDFPDDFEAV